MSFGSDTQVVAIVACVALMAVAANTVARRRLLHRERMSAIQKGVPLPEDVPAEGDPESRLRWAAKNAALHGTIWTSLGIGMLAASRLVHNPELGSGMRQLLAALEVWAYPAIFVGVGLLIFAFFSRPKKN